MTQQTELFDELLGVADTARRLGVHEATLRRWERQGKLRPVGRVHGARVYLRSQIEHFAAHWSKRKGRQLAK